MMLSTMLKNKKFSIPKPVKRLLIVAFWLGVWQCSYLVIQQEILIVSPVDVFSRLMELVITKKFWLTTLASLFRIVLGYLYALVVGTMLATLCAVLPPAGEVLAPALSIVKSTPVASFIILALVWMKTGNVPILVSFLIVLPTVWGNLFEGIRNTDRRLLEMARVYHIKPLRRLKQIYFPSVLPYFMAAAKTSLGFAWKAGIAAEVISIPKYAIGTQLYHSKVYIETVDLFAWTVVVILLSVLLEKLFVKGMTLAGDRLLHRKWRRRYD